MNAYALLLFLPFVCADSAPFLGCFKASFVRKTGIVTNSDAETCTNSDMCIQACRSNAYTLAALTKTGDCVCTHTVPPSGIAGIACDEHDPAALWDLQYPSRSFYKNTRVTMHTPGAPVPEWASVVCKPPKTDSIMSRVLAGAVGFAILFILD